ncbi:FadR family transcriptional regulator, partial [bacterium]|nr:FadR family transcriptional regulator [bacterium]
MRAIEPLGGGSLRRNVVIRVGGRLRGRSRRRLRPQDLQVLAREIVKAIYEEGLKPGDLYFSEEQALQRHQVARNTLREALRYLEFQGALEMKPGPGGGAVVAQPDWTHLASTLALLLQFSGSPLRSVLEARTAIEPGVAELAALNGGPALVQKLDGELAAMEKDVVNYQRFHAA